MPPTIQKVTVGEVERVSGWNPLVFLRPSPMRRFFLSADRDQRSRAATDGRRGEIIELKILPALIPKPISCKALVIGKIPKIPPGFALKFEDLKAEDKEAIEFFVQESLKRESAKKNKV